MRSRAYLIWSLLVLALSYSIPYSLLRNCRNLNLYLFWLLLTLAHFAVTLAYLRGGSPWRN